MWLSISGKNEKNFLKFFLICNILIQVMRPELVTSTQRLCADTYSGFVRLDPKVKLYEAQVDLVTNQLKSKIIPHVC